MNAKSLADELQCSLITAALPPTSLVVGAKCSIAQLRRVAAGGTGTGGRTAGSDCGQPTAPPDGLLGGSRLGALRLTDSNATGGTSEPAAYTRVGTAKGQVHYAVVEDVD